MAFAGGVKWGDADEAVNSAFVLEVAVGVFSGDFDCGSADSCNVASFVVY